MNPARWVSVLVAAAICAPPPAAAQDPQGVQEVEGGVLVDFQDADVRFVVTALAEAAGLNVVYGDLPARKVTLRMQRPVAPADILPLLRNLATAYGLSVIEEGSFIRVTAAQAAPAPMLAPEAQEPAGELRLFVYHLKHVPVARLAATLQSLFGGGGAAPQRRPRALSERMRDNQIPPVGQDAPVQAELEPTPEVGLPAQIQGDVQIVADETSNALLVRAQPADWEVIRQAIVALDGRPLQVLIEVVIAEVRQTRDRGISVAGEVSNQSGRETIGGTLTGATGGDVVLSFLRTGALNVDAALSLLSSRGEVKILSRPVLLAQNNQEARILIGSERPFVQVSRSLPTDGAARDQVIQYRDVGTQLTITPTINADGYVNLLVLQEVSSATAETQFDAPIISTREATTALFVRDGQTAVIGGLIDRLDERTKSGIPLLMDVPLLGSLFGTTRRTEIVNELFLFLTPHIVDGDEDMDRIRQGVEDNAEQFRRVLPDGVPVLIDPRVAPAEDSSDVP